MSSAIKRRCSGRFLYAQLRVTEVVDRFLHNLGDGLKLRDVVKEITEIDPTIRISLEEKMSVVLSVQFVLTVVKISNRCSRGYESGL